jgi:hypothetical protein
MLGPNGADPVQHDDMATILGQFGQGGSNASGITNFFGMFGDWVAPGFDVNPFTLLNGQDGMQ